MTVLDASGWLDELPPEAPPAELELPPVLPELLPPAPLAPPDVPLVPPPAPVAPPDAPLVPPDVPLAPPDAPLAPPDAPPVAPAPPGVEGDVPLELAPLEPPLLELPLLEPPLLEPPLLELLPLELEPLLPPLPALTTLMSWLPASTVAYPVICPDGTPLKTFWPSMVTSYFPPPLARFANRISDLESALEDALVWPEALCLLDVPAEPLLPELPWASVSAVSSPRMVTPRLLSNELCRLRGLMTSLLSRG